MNLSEKHPKAHGEGLEVFDDEKEHEYLQKINNWTLDKSQEIHKIKKEFQFPTFKDSMNFVNKIADLANQENHHPNILIYFKKIILEFSTNHLKGLTENDFIMASKVDEMTN